MATWKRDRKVFQYARTARLLFVIALQPLVFGFSTGCEVFFPLEGPQEVPDEREKNNAYDCSCTCKKGNSTVMTVNASVCMPTDLNPNIPAAPGPAPTLDQLVSDCQTRVQNNVTEMTRQCVSNTVTCTCNAPGGTLFAAECNGNCTDAGCDGQCSEEILAQGCVNFDPKAHVKTATNVLGQPPVCLVSSSDPPDPIPDTLTAGIYGQTSRCEVEGAVTVGLGGDTASEDGNGVVDITGAACPGESCQVGMAYRLDHVDDFGFDAFAGFSRAEIQNIVATGATLPAAATLDTAGVGSFPAFSTKTSGKGRRSNQLCVPHIGCEETSSDTRGYVGTNGSPIDIQVDWLNHTCAVSGSVLGMIEDEDANVAVDLAGIIVNEPPKANAGADTSIECTSAAGAQITLDATGSTDPEDNIGLYVWRKGSRSGDELGTDPIIHLNQGFGGAQTYVLRVVDAYGQSDEDSTAVTIKDSTPPTITNLSISPTTLSPPNHKMVPVTVTVAATDTCSTPTCQITGVSSNEPIDGLGDGDASPDWEITGAKTVNLRAERSGKGTGRVYTVTVTCTDGSGNPKTGTTTVTVAR